MSQLIPEPLSAKWIGYHYHPKHELGIFEFRLITELSSVPETCPVRLSADQRYQLFVNGVLVCFGPQRGDIQHWFFEEIDLSPFLKVGENTLLARVTQFGRWAPMAQHSARTAFFLDNPTLRTPGAWQVRKLEGWNFDMLHSGVGEFYIDIGPGEIYNSTISATDWQSPHIICDAELKGKLTGGTPWMLIPRSIPLMKYRNEGKCGTLRAGFVGASPSEQDSAFKTPIQVGPDSPKVIDLGELVCAFPRVTLRAVENLALLKITYAESPWIVGTNEKPNRNDVAGNEIRGFQDHVIVDKESAIFEPTWWRTYRYLLLEADAEIVISGLEHFETGYPYQVESAFTSDNGSTDAFWDVGVRTAKLCAGETYFDCPYYEQLQYAGDTRIQALIGYYLGTDRQLQRNAVESMAWSINDMGLLQSRYPSRQAQFIPPFSLWWVMMSQDQVLYDNVPKEQYQELRATILDGWRRLPEHQIFWNFADWVPGWRWGVPPGGLQDPIHRLTYLMAAAREGIPSDEEFTESEILSSEHAYSLYRIYCQLKDQPLPEWRSDVSPRCTYYFSYYKHQAMFLDGVDRDYLAQLEPWLEMLELGLSTFAENPEPTRSDCHAWSAHPILGFFSIIAGVSSIAPNWSKARITPHPGGLKFFDARIAHTQGELRVRWEDQKFMVDSPVPFEFVWNSKSADLKPGRHILG